jgi:salicylate hydroxylase
MVLAVPDDLPPRVSRQKGNLAEMRVLFDGWDPRLQRLLARVSDVEKWRLRSRARLSLDPRSESD